MREAVYCWAVEVSDAKLGAIVFIYLCGKMLLTTVLLTLLVSVTTHPVHGDENEPTTLETFTDLIPEQFQKDVIVVGYIQNFKNLMAEYVISQYKNLTVKETNKVKETLEEFLTNFARDLREAVEKQHRNEEFRIEEDKTEKVEDGIPDSTFDEIKNRIRTEFPEINEDTASEIVYRLRTNLFQTRQKLDHIIRDSKQAHSELSID